MVDILKETAVCVFCAVTCIAMGWHASEVPIHDQSNTLSEASQYITATTIPGHPNLPWTFTSFDVEITEIDHSNETAVLDLYHRMKNYTERLPPFSCTDYEDLYDTCVCTYGQEDAFFMCDRAKLASMDQFEICARFGSDGKCGA